MQINRQETISMTRPGWAAGAKVGERPFDAAERDDNGDDQLFQ